MVSLTTDEDLATWLRARWSFKSIVDKARESRTAETLEDLGFDVLEDIRPPRADSSG
jgi:hypothetical protein